MNNRAKPLVHDETSLGFMLKLAGPMVITTVSFTLMQFVDRIMVSRLGTAALAAVLPAGFVASIPAMCTMGVFASVGTFVSQCFGRGQKKECTSYFWQAIYMGLAFSLLVLAVCWPLAPAIFRSFGHEPEVVALEVIYFRITLFSNVAVVFVWAGTQFFMGIHRPILSMYASLIAQVVNITLNYVFIFGKFGFPKMGIAGAAWGTVIGIIVGGGIRMTTFLSGDVRRDFENRQMFKVDFRKMADLLKVGFPAGIELAVSTGLWGAILFWLVGRFGKEAQAATSAGLACTNLSIMPIEGFRIALTAAVGKSIGAGKEQTAVKQTHHCLRLALAYMGLVGLSFLLFGRTFMRLWSSDDKVIEIGTEVLVLAAVYQVFYASRTVYSGALRGAGDTLWLAAASALGAVVVLGLGGYVIIKLFPNFGAVGPWAAATLSIIAVGLANRARFKSNKWKHIDLFGREPVEVQITEQ
ncbi:MAG: MATE family efflux transporter [Sedimentisphaerales bacterium]|nr:MATE family efflux transporter [Sedimentisphaerales bacterium]